MYALLALCYLVDRPVLSCDVDGLVFQDPDCPFDAPLKQADGAPTITKAFSGRPIGLIQPISCSPLSSSEMKSSSLFSDGLVGFESSRPSEAPVHASYDCYTKSALGAPSRRWDLASAGQKSRPSTPLSVRNTSQQAENLPSRRSSNR